MCKPIADYGIIGDCRSAALVARDGSIDWLCWPRFDSPALFCALLDAQRGGSWSIAPRDVREITRGYVENTNVLQTRFRCAAGTVVLTDLMPVAGEEFKRAHMVPDHEIVRQVEGGDGECELEIVFRPRWPNGRGENSLRDCGALGIRMEFDRAVCWLRSSIPMQIAGGEARATVHVRAGERIQFSLSYAEESPAALPALGDRVTDAIERSVQWWRDWASRAEYRGEYRDAVVRSALALKLMTYAPSGAIIAAPTTSLPERIGGDLNWDYRYCWLRDASLTMRSMLGLGYREEAHAFMSWLLHATRITQPQLQILYTVFGQHPPNERELDLAGYCGSKPVRVGNAAKDQLQLDVYGEVIDAAAQYAYHGGDFDGITARVLRGFAEYVCDNWRQPDEGIWEPRGGRAPHTHSRLLCWVALDRMVQLAERGLIAAPRARFATVRDEIADDLRQNAWNEAIQSYAARVGGDNMDASLLLLAWYGFEPSDSARMLATHARVRRELGAGDLLYRYREGIPEGAFGICSFWEAEYLALGGGTLREACALFEKLLERRNDLGLLAEEIDPQTGAALGNFPQAFTHIGLISAALTIVARQQGRDPLAHREVQASPPGVAA